ncbi:MAG: hypothetical protein A2600_01060 [Candidatus Lambdaproteobacteria bacterium RIFOXYD1_FULL_56_27]|nr:MAG: hypothetical protein A2426_13010 [Candidatus Lambdaproteobacteria bacterium RIFOXYC1_FULL_56_13]OGH06869.1 MAG: hypothetical protein A2600_01060 [Candidatus Lambdaproteobacteria bacterium RIFOXYD1_FULL_56_27]
MKHWFWLGLLLATFSAPAAAQVPDFDLGRLGFLDQWDQPLPNPGSVKWVLTGRDMESRKWAHEAFEARGRSWMEAKGLVFIADISGMPKLITKFMALPKMRGYSYSLYLDKEGLWVKTWPGEEGRLTLVKMNQGHPQESFILAGLAELDQALGGP